MLALAFVVWLFGSKLIADGMGHTDLFAVAGSISYNVSIQDVVQLASCWASTVVAAPTPVHLQEPPTWPTDAPTLTYTPYYGQFASHDVTVFVGSQDAADEFVQYTGQSVFVATSPVLLRVLADAQHEDYYILDDGRILTDFACAIGHSSDSSHSHAYTATVKKVIIRFPNSKRAKDAVQRFLYLANIDRVYTLPQPSGTGRAYASSFNGRWSIEFTIGNAYVELLESRNAEKTQYYTNIVAAERRRQELERQALEARRLACVAGAQAAIDGFWINRIKSVVVDIVHVFASLISVTEFGRTLVESAVQDPEAFFGTFIVLMYTKLSGSFSSAGHLDIFANCSAVHEVSSDDGLLSSWDGLLVARSLGDEWAVNANLVDATTEVASVLEESGGRSVSKRESDMSPPNGSEVQVSDRGTIVAHGSDVEDKPAVRAFLDVCLELIHIVFAFITLLYHLVKSTVSTVVASITRTAVHWFQGAVDNIKRHKTFWSYLLAPFIVGPLMFRRRRPVTPPPTPSRRDRGPVNVGRRIDGFVLSRASVTSAVVASTIATVPEVTISAGAASVSSPVLKTSPLAPLEKSEALVQTSVPSSTVGIDLRAGDGATLYSSGEGELVVTPISEPVGDTASPSFGFTSNPSSAVTSGGLATSSPVLQGEKTTSSIPDVADEKDQTASSTLSDTTSDAASVVEADDPEEAVEALAIPLNSFPLNAEDTENWTQVQAKVTRERVAAPVKTDTGKKKRKKNRAPVARPLPVLDPMLAARRALQSQRAHAAYLKNQARLRAEAAATVVPARAPAVAGPSRQIAVTLPTGNASGPGKGVPSQPPASFAKVTAATSKPKPAMAPSTKSRMVILGSR